MNCHELYWVIFFRVRVIPNAIFLQEKNLESVVWQKPTKIYNDARRVR